jgi:hypothetical protein
MRKDWITATEGMLLMEWTAGSGRVEREHIVTMRYRLKGKMLQPVGKPERRPCDSRCGREG